MMYHSIVHDVKGEVIMYVEYLSGKPLVIAG